MKLEHVWNFSWKNKQTNFLLLDLLKLAVSKTDSFDTTCLDSMLYAWYPKSCLSVRLSDRVPPIYSISPLLFSSFPRIQFVTPTVCSSSLF